MFWLKNKRFIEYQYIINIIYKMNKIIIVITVILLGIFLIFLMGYLKEPNKEVVKNNQAIMGYDTSGNPVYKEYSGPVPEECNSFCEEHYRKTGITNTSK